MVKVPIGNKYRPEAVERRDRDGKFESYGRVAPSYGCLRVQRALIGSGLDGWRKPTVDEAVAFVGVAALLVVGLFGGFA